MPNGSPRKCNRTMLVLKDLKPAHKAATEASSSSERAALVIAGKISDANARKALPRAVLTWRRSIRELRCNGR